jgi:hypothetical protein
MGPETKRESVRVCNIEGIGSFDAPLIAGPEGWKDRVEVEEPECGPSILLLPSTSRDWRPASASWTPRPPPSPPRNDRHATPRAPAEALVGRTGAGGCAAPDSLRISHTLTHSLCFLKVRRGTNIRTDTKENIKGIMRKVDLFASDGPKRVITKNDLIAAIVQRRASRTSSARRTTSTRCRPSDSSFRRTVGLLLPRGRMAAHELYAEMSREVKGEIVIKEMVR